MSSYHADLMVLGGGPAGYAAAFRAADLGRQVVLCDPRPTLGGVCLNEGCIPSKALLHAAALAREIASADQWGLTCSPVSPDIRRMAARKDQIVAGLVDGLRSLATRRNVQVVHAGGVLTGPSSIQIGRENWSFSQLIIAVGSSAIRFAGWPEDRRNWDSSRALDLPIVPKRLGIVGGGIIGLEMATIYSALGSRVTIIEMGSQLLPTADAEAVGIVQGRLVAEGTKIHVGTTVESLSATDEALLLTLSGGPNSTIEVDAVIQAVGRRSNGREIGAELAGVTVNGRGEIPVDESCRTSQPHIFAAGDVTGGPMLAHRATHQGKVAAEVACGHRVKFGTQLIPSVAYTSPEIAWVGEQANAAASLQTTKFPWSASGRNLTSGRADGLTKIYHQRDTGKIVGGTVVGLNASELVAELTLAIEMGAVVEDLALTIHPHPTLSETLSMASERALGRLTDL